MLAIYLKLLFCLGILLSLISGCGLFKREPTITPLISSTSIAAPVQADNFILTDCPFKVPEDIPPEMVRQIQCANLTVLEDRQQPDRPKIQIAVAIVKTDSPSPKPDPVLVLIGNPGYGLYIAYALPYIFKSISTDRDMIIIDQRGTGYSEPSLACPQLANLGSNANANSTLQAANDQLIEASQVCADRLIASGTHLSAYTTSAVAADLEELRQVMAINQWNIYSFFNGSRLALTMMREYPQGIRSVVLDSPVPPQANPAAEWGTNVLAAFDKLFQHCTENEQCLEAYPNLKGTFFTLLGQLDEKPILVDVADLNTGNRYKVTLDSERLITYFLRVLISGNDSEALREIPRMIFQLRGGKTEAIARLMGIYSNNFPLSAMSQWMDCNEEYTFFSLDQVTQANQEIDLHLRKYFDTQAEDSFSACKPWKAKGVFALENQPVDSSIPALLLSGEFDWLQPPIWAEKVAQTLRNSTVVEFPGTGQAPSVSSQSSVCSQQITSAFLETPMARPDISCAHAS